MILIRRTIPFFLGALCALLLYATTVWTGAVAFLTIVTAGVAGALVGGLSGYGKDLEGWWHVALTPVVFVVSCATFLLFMEPLWVAIALPMIAGAFLFFFGEHLFRFIHTPSLYQPYALEHTSLVLHIASIYFLSTTFFGLQTFLQTPVWLLALFFFLVATALTYETLWVSKIRDASALKVALILGLVFTEFFVSFSLLPTSFFVNAAVTSVLFYTIIGMMRASLLQKLSRGVLRRYLLVGCVLSLLLLLTAQWI